MDNWNKSKAPCKIKWKSSWSKDHAFYYIYNLMLNEELQYCGLRWSQKKKKKKKKRLYSMFTIVQSNIEGCL